MREEVEVWQKFSELSEALMLNAERFKSFLKILAVVTCFCWKHSKIYEDVSILTKYVFL